jgi:hypothetical protein
MGSRLFVTAVVVTALSVAPAVAVACETFCAGHATSHAFGHPSAHPSGQEAAHASHVHGADADGTAAIVTSGAHDCESHERIAAPPSTLERPTSSLDSPAVVLFEPGSAARGVASAVVPVGATHGPPGTPATTTVSVLRI